MPYEAVRYFDDKHVCKGDDGLMHYLHTFAGVWCTALTHTAGPPQDRRGRVVTCLWCAGQVSYHA